MGSWGMRKGLRRYQNPQLNQISTGSSLKPRAVPVQFCLNLAKSGEILIQQLLYLDKDVSGVLVCTGHFSVIRSGKSVSVSWALSHSPRCPNTNEGLTVLTALPPSTRELLLPMAVCSREVGGR